VSTVSLLSTSATPPFEQAAGVAGGVTTGGGVVTGGGMSGVDGVVVAGAGAGVAAGVAGAPGVAAGVPSGPPLEAAGVEAEAAGAAESFAGVLLVWSCAVESSSSPAELFVGGAALLQPNAASESERRSAPVSRGCRFSMSLTRAHRIPMTDLRREARETAETAG
jgi:hypothetical protein